MNAELLKMAASQGIWALLFVTLLWYVLNTSAKREDKLIEANDKTLNALNDLSKQYGLLTVTVNDIKEDIKGMKG